MIPIEARAHNYRSFETLPPTSYPSGLTALTGENGDGKSSFLNLVDVCLFAGRGELSPLVRVGEDDMELELTFEHLGDVFRTRRGWRKGKPTLDFEQELIRESDGTIAGWSTLTAETADATQRRIEQTLGLSRDTFRASQFLRQGDPSFTQVDRSRRRWILAQLVGLGEVFDKLVAACRAELRAAEDTLVSLRTRRESAEMTAGRKPEVEAGLKAARLDEESQLALVGLMEKRLEELQRAREELVEKRALAETARVEHEAAVAAKTRVGAQLDEARQASQDRSRLLVELSKIKPLADRIEELERILDVRQETLRKHVAATLEKKAALEAVQSQAARVASLREAQATAERQYADIASRIVHLEQAEDGSERCDRCEQILGSEARQAALLTLRGERDALDARIAGGVTGIEAGLRLENALRQEWEELTVPEVPAHDPTPDLSRAREAATRVAAINAQIETLADKATRITEWEVEWNMVAGQAEEKRTALDAAQAAVPAEQFDPETTREDLARARADLDQSRSRIARDTVALEQVEQAEQELSATSTELAETERRIAELTLCESCYSRDGAGALIVEAIAVPQIETEANRILAELGTSYQVELRTQSLTAKGDLVEDLDIIIHDGPYERQYETYSGGEQTCLKLALQLALAELLARRTGAANTVLMLDEPEFLSESRITRLVEVLRGLSFEKVILVTHNAAGASSCDNQLHVVKDEHGSRVVDGTEGLRVAV